MTNKRKVNRTVSDQLGRKDKAFQTQLLDWYDANKETYLGDKRRTLTIFGLVRLCCNKQVIQLFILRTVY